MSSGRLTLIKNLFVGSTIILGSAIVYNFVSEDLTKAKSKRYFRQQGVVESHVDEYHLRGNE